MSPVDMRIRRGDIAITRRAKRTIARRRRACGVECALMRGGDTSTRAGDASHELQRVSQRETRALLSPGSARIRVRGVLFAQ